VLDRLDDVDARVAQLSARQIDCLRLLLVAGSSKGVAEILRIAPGTVDQHLKAARRLLGVHDSWTAAQLLAARVIAPPQNMDNQPRPIAPIPAPGPTAFRSDETDRSEQEEADPTSIASRDVIKRTLVDRIGDSLHLLFPPAARTPNDLTMERRLVVIATRTVIALLAVALLFGSVALISWVFFNIARHGD
jgi:DNA-binding CsgD family transcriptional regulator